MVRYGAELVFSSEAGKVTDADIDTIITKGEKDTKALNDKMASFTDDAMKFTMDGGVAYDFKEEESDGEGVDFKQLVGHNWVDPPERKRKRAMHAEQAYYSSQVMQTKGDKARKLPKMPQLQDFQFYNTERLEELFAKEVRYLQHKGTKKEGEEGGAEEEEEDAPPADPSDPQPLSEEETAVRGGELLKSCWLHWIPGCCRL
jgi:SWI/SNF-related matrix-associated actin-dependent regulator of chromatin subfamily A member 5